MAQRASDARADLDVAHKDLEVCDVKVDEKGEVEAIVATCGVIDKDFDIIAETAIKDGSKVKVSSYGHNAMYGDTPVGKGTITMDGNKAVFKGKLFLATQAGRETFEVLKEMGKDQEWSFGFRVLGSEAPSEEQRKRGVYRILTKLDAFEVSPVLRGAGEGTRTLTVKEEKPLEQVADPIVEPTPEEIAAKAAETATAAAAAQEAERIGAADQLQFKARSAEAAEEFQRIQRTNRRLGVTL